MKVIHQRHLKHPQLVERFRQETHFGSPSASIDSSGASGLDDLKMDGISFPAGNKGVAVPMLRQRREGVQEVVVEWSIRRLLSLFQKVCETVAYAHSQGVIHRDLKPSNIMTGQFGAVLVVDWVWPRFNRVKLLRVEDVAFQH